MSFSAKKITCRGTEIGLAVSLELIVMFRVTKWPMSD